MENVKEYQDLIKKASGEFWTYFKKNITADMTGEEYWHKVYKEMSDMVEKYRETDAEGYAVDMCVFYIKQLQRISLGRLRERMDNPVKK